MMIPGKVEKFVYLINVGRLNVTDLPIGILPSCFYRGVREVNPHEEQLTKEVLSNYAGRMAKTICMNMTWTQKVSANVKMAFRGEYVNS